MRNSTPLLLLVFNDLLYPKMLDFSTRLVAVAANRLQPPNFTWNRVKFFAVAMAMAAKFALFHIKFATVSLDHRHRNKSTEECILCTNCSLGEA